MIRFHFDFLSPYAYLAWVSIHALAAEHGRTVIPVPTLLAALLAHGGTKGPAEIPAKRVYVFKDTVRSASVLGVPLIPPPTHPFNPLLALRASGLVEGEAQKALVDELFRGAWGGGGGCESPEAVAKAAGRAGLDGADLVRRAGEPAAKDRLRAATDEAIANGVFGVPTMRVEADVGPKSGGPHQELFWGLDSFAHLERFLGGEDPVRGVDLAQWASTAASASRRT
jgi:2-hydroxychromene-2-carboxylate isomerase